MKAIIGFIKLVVVFGFMAGAFLLLINKTFVHEVYKEEEIMQGSGIPISKFMYYQDRTGDIATFITPLNAGYLNTFKSDYLDSLEECYGKYYYDDDNYITITKYNIVDNDYYRTVSIAFNRGNYCSDDYVLSDMWVYEYNNVSSYVDGDIPASSMTNLINTVYASTRVNEPIIDDTYESQVSLSVKCKNNDNNYTLTFSDFNTNQLLIVKNDGESEQFAVYEIENVVNYLNSLG